ncbi:MAG: hypothetical protein JWN86_1580 [Planctomycetota bacterium]|nr:hypothetical protein [Planctomycetota bacterium]
MKPRIVPSWVPRVVILLSLMSSAGLAQDASSSEKAEKTFATMLATAKQDPEKADWKALRHGFTETKAYKPYNGEWRKELAAVRGQVQRGETKEAEAALDKLMIREGFMRLDAHGLATVLYAKTGQKEKLDLHSKFARGIASTLYVPGTGQSIEKPIEVLFVDEEYLFLDSLKLKRAKQGLHNHEGHWIDVLETEPKNGGEGEKFYFNVDLPRKHLEKMFESLKTKKLDK